MEVKPGFKLTDVGVIPKDWEVKALDGITDCLDNLRVPLNESQRARRRGDIPYCGANGVLDWIDDFVIDDDIILMAEDGGYFDEYLTRPIAYRMIGKCWVNNHAHILKAKPGTNQDFIHYSLVHKNILRYLATGTRAKLNRSELNKIEVPVPPTKAEQEAIAETLSDADTPRQAIQKTRNAKEIPVRDEGWLVSAGLGKSCNLNRTRRFPRKKKFVLRTLESRSLQPYLCHGKNSDGRFVPFVPMPFVQTMRQFSNGWFKSEQRLVLHI
jgi:Type I restriction modification DNA specificity domain